jgi:hypothetical protein
MYMTKTITVSVEEESEKKFRKAAYVKYGRRKGSLGKALSEAIKNWAEQNQDMADERLLKLMNKGFKMGKILGNRSEWHGR